MIIDTTDDRYQNSACRIRCMKSLVEQVRIDYREFNKLRRICKKDEENIGVAKELTRRLCWIKQGLNVLNALGQGTIEGVLWGELEEIEKDVMNKKFDLERVAPDSKEPEATYTHLR